MIGFAHIDKVYVPAMIPIETQRFLRTVGKQSNEGLALWVGKMEGNHFQVLHLLIPRQRGVRTADGVCAIVDSDELHRINVELFKSEMKLFAQVHSHPTDAYHSDTDDEHAIANTVGCLSVVVPDFATRDFSLNDCAIYRLNRKGVWQLLGPGTVNALIDIQET